jgi:Domain of unknown function (DUF4440)
MPIALILAAAAQAASPPPPAMPLPPQPALTQAIAARDAEFFELFFQGCDPDRLATMLADDVEMYHDKGGFVIRSAAQMVAEYAKSCEERKRPDAWRSRRELVAASLRVHPVPGHGAIEEGEHLFYERKGDGPEKRVGRARFAQLWVLSPGGWRLSRIFSFDHGPAD